MSSFLPNRSHDSQVDTYIPDETPYIPSTDRDCIARDKERLQRFHKEAMSFLSKAYSNDQTVLVEDRFDNTISAARSNDDFLSQRRVELDRVRLERFHAQAVSFLDRAYANEPGTIVVEESLSPGMANPLEEDKAMLRRFHEEAMNFLDAAAAGGSGLNGQEFGHLRDAASKFDRTSWRIERDKKRLEQHYQDAMSFLDRSESGKRGVFVEEQELEPAYVDRLQLQRYAQDAMSFLDKAFRNDASVMIGDEEDFLVPDDSKTLSVEEQSKRRIADPKATSGLVTQLEQILEKGKVGLHGTPTHGAGSRCDEEKQIAADRAALERYDEEFGDFLSKAYLDDSTIIVEDADSETSGTERGLFARRMAPSTASGDTPRSGRSTKDDSSEDANTDDEFQDPPDAESAQMETLQPARPTEAWRFYADHPNSSGNVERVDENAAIRLRMMHYEREAADYLDGTNVSVDGEDDDNDDDNATYPCPTQQVGSPRGKQLLSLEQGAGIQDLGKLGHEIVEETENDDDEEFGADRLVDDETIPRGFYDDKVGIEDSKNTLRKFEAPAMRFPDRVEFPRRNSPSQAKHLEPLRQSKSSELLVDVIVEDNTGRSHKWSEVPLEKSFYRQVPRGSTIKLRPRMLPRLSSSSRTESTETRGSSGGMSLGELQRVEKERDALMATLEEIVNERSMLAAQVSEMKAMITNAGGRGAQETKKDNETEDIDLAAELRDAHATMAKLTEEMEATLSVLDNRYQATLERAHKAEEKCIRLETNAARMEKEFSKQGMRLSLAMSEENRLTALLNKSERDMDVVRIKAESDMKKVDDTHREELDRSVLKILELTTEISVLQEKVKSGTSASAERRMDSPNRKLEMEIAGLKRRITESDRKLTEERSAHSEALQTEVQKVNLDRQREIERLNSQIEKLHIEAQTAEEAKRELRRRKAEASHLAEKTDGLERQVEELKLELRDEKRGHLTAAAEAAHIRTRYEESLKKRMAQIDQKTEMMELEAALAHLKEEAGARERRLQQQLSEFRLRAEQAEAAATQAENDAREAAEVAKIAQERSRAMVEVERKARRQAELEKQTAVIEWKKWERVAAVQHAEAQMTKESESSGDLVKSSSRRGLRKSPSKNGVKEGGRRRRDHSKGGGSEEGGKKKGSLRPRLFG